MTPYARTRDLARNYNRAGLLALLRAAGAVLRDCPRGHKGMQARLDQSWRIRALTRALKETPE